MKEDVMTKMIKIETRHMERRNDSTLTKEIYRTIIEGNIGIGRVRRTFSDHIEDVLKKECAVRRIRRLI